MRQRRWCVPSQHRWCAFVRHRIYRHHHGSICLPSPRKSVTAGNGFRASLAHRVSTHQNITSYLVIYNAFSSTVGGNTRRTETTSSLTGGNIAGSFVGDGAIISPFRDSGDAALGGESGAPRAAHTTALAALFKTTRMPLLPQLLGGLDAGDIARAGAH